LAREKMKAYRPGNGIYQNVPSMINDPAVIYCDPQIRESDGGQPPPAK
jgi:hypothetical protein